MCTASLFLANINEAKHFAKPCNNLCKSVCATAKILLVWAWLCQIKPERARWLCIDRFQRSSLATNTRVRCHPLRLWAINIQCYKCNPTENDQSKAWHNCFSSAVSHTANLLPKYIMDRVALSMTREEELISRSEMSEPGNVSSEKAQSHTKGEAITQMSGPGTKWKP